MLSIISKEAKMSKTVKIKINCTKCDATGIYSGMAEKGNCGVPCLECKGSGVILIEGTEFTGKKVRTDIEKVFPNTYMVISDFSRGGVSYEQWLANPNSVDDYGNELRDYNCPFEVYQSIHSNLNTSLWKTCSNCLIPGDPIKNCGKFLKKHFCWEQLDKFVKENNIGNNLWDFSDDVKKGKL